MLELLYTCALTTAAIFVLTYFTSLYRTDVSIVDISWGLGFIAIGITCLLNAAITIPLALTVVMVTLWGTRLSSHIFQRKLKSPTEDKRYNAMRKKWGSNFWLVSFFTVFVTQWILQLIIALPIMVIASNAQAELNTLFIVGVVIWLAGFVFEVVADAQLTSFIANEKSEQNPIMTKGLWSLSRHPNYFGEALLWWGIWVASIPSGMLWSILGPMSITILVRFVSGVPLLENYYRGNAKFEEYKQNVRIFLPIPK